MKIKDYSDERLAEVLEELAESCMPSQGFEKKIYKEVAKRLRSKVKRERDDAILQVIRYYQNGGR